MAVITALSENRPSQDGFASGNQPIEPTDVTAKARQLPDFDLLSIRPDVGRRAIEVKGRAGVGEIDVSENEWAKACNLRDHYWLYVVFDCASPRPRLVRVRDPFRNLLVKARGGVVIASAQVLSAAAPDETPGGSTG